MTPVENCDKCGEQVRAMWSDQFGWWVFNCKICSHQWHEEKEEQDEKQTPANS